MTTRKSRLLLSALAVGLPVMASLALAGSPDAGAAGSTLHFFSKISYQAITDANGKPVPSSASAAAGDVVVSDDLDYVGSHSHHAKNWTASDHLVCSLTDSSGAAVCFGEFAVGGSLLYADGVSVNIGGNTNTVQLTGGTGAYRNITGGTVTSTPVGKTNNTDVTIALH